MLTKTTVNIDKKLIIRIATFIVPVVLYITVFSIGLVGEGTQQFSMLANSFIHGHTYFLKSIGGVGQDPVNYHGKVYWDEGPFPAVILMPFVAFFKIWHIFFYQGYIKWLFVLGISYFVYALARKLKYSIPDSLIWMFGFTLGSVFIGVSSISSGWLYAQVVGVFLALWSLHEYMNKCRWWLIGSLMGCLLLTRIPAAVMAIFFVISIVKSKADRKHKKLSLVQLALPLVIAGILIGLYNYQRFGSPLNNGNQYQLLSQASSEARSKGVFSLSHIPTNLYTAIVRGPIPVLATNTSWSLKFPYVDNNPLGVSIFITSPYLLYFFIKRWKSYPTEAKWLIITSLVGALFILSYFGDGADQMGYRYSLDFFPALFLALMMIYRKNSGNLSSGMKMLLLVTGFTNFWLLTTYLG